MEHQQLLSVPCPSSQRPDLRTMQVLSRLHSYRQPGKPNRADLAGLGRFGRQKRTSFPGSKEVKMPKMIKNTSCLAVATPVNW